MEKHGMARSNDIEKMSFAELTDLERRIARLKAQKQDAERSTLRQKLTNMAREHGFDIRDLIGGRGKGGGKGSVAPKYRDPKNPQNTWTGRGRMPRSMAAAT
jgi:DNA-binding protein H-NS